MRKIKEDLNKWISTLCSWIRILNIFKVHSFQDLFIDSIQSKFNINRFKINQNPKRLLLLGEIF